MKTVTAYESDDGQLHRDEASALRADAKHWKKVAHERESDRERERDFEPGYKDQTGLGHQ